MIKILLILIFPTLIYLIAAILYFLNPLDVIPDMILALGFLDDFTVISFVYGKIAEEIEKYREWKYPKIDSKS